MKFRGVAHRLCVWSMGNAGWASEPLSPWPQRPYSLVLARVGSSIIFNLRDEFNFSVKQSIDRLRYLLGNPFKPIRC